MTDYLQADDGPRRGRRLAYIVDDDAEIRQSLAFLLEAMDTEPMVFANGPSFLQRLDELVPAPILLDVRMAGLDGVAVLAELATRKAGWPVIMITGHGDIAIAVKSMKLGAIDFLEKPFDAEALEISLTRAFDLLSRLSKTLEQQQMARRQLGTLTARESDVVRVLVDGAPNKIVAYRLGLSPRTVEMHRANAFAKLGLKNIADLVKLVGTAGAYVPQG